MRRLLLTQNDGEKRWLVAVAAVLEAQAVIEGIGGHRPDAEPSIDWRPRQITGRFDVVITGVSKANAAGGVAMAYDPAQHMGVLSIGVGGALPGSGLDLGDVVLASRSIFADEGAITPSGYEDIASMGFPPDQGIGEGAMSVAISPSLLEALEPVAEAIGTVACVSTCSGTDEAAREVVRRTDAIVEAMEGAAAGLAARRVGGAASLFGEMRIISNTTGDRDRQMWRLTEAIDRLREVCSLL